ncbi:MAG: hypothetical protein ACK58L_17870 [Planctomycetota bacterium]
MIAPAESQENDASETTPAKVPDFLVLARYGRVPQVARFAGFGTVIARDQSVVVSTERGDELAICLQCLPAPKASDSAPALTGECLRIATPDDLNRNHQLTERGEGSFPIWLKRVVDWKLQLELIDLEFTLDERLILYVLNERNAETTRFALLSAAAGLGIVHVQPVSTEGIVPSGGGGGCGSCSTSGGCH